MWIWCLIALSFCTARFWKLNGLHYECRQEIKEQISETQLLNNIEIGNRMYSLLKKKHNLRQCLNWDAFRTSSMELFEKIVNSWKSCKLFSQNSSILDLWLGSEYMYLCYISGGEACNEGSLTFLHCTRRNKFLDVTLISCPISFVLISFSLMLVMSENAL